MKIGPRFLRNPSHIILFVVVVVVVQLSLMISRLMHPCAFQRSTKAHPLKHVRLNKQYYRSRCAFQCFLFVPTEPMRRSFNSKSRERRRVTIVFDFEVDLWFIRNAVLELLNDTQHHPGKIQFSAFKRHHIGGNPVNVTTPVHRIIPNIPYHTPSLCAARTSKQGNNN